MGCPGDILLIYAETAALAHWKQQQLLLGALDTNDLLTRGAAIENRLLVSNIAVSTATSASTGFPGPEMNAQMHPSGPAGEHSAPSPAATVHMGTGPAVEAGMGAVGASEASLVTPSSTAAEASTANPSSKLYHSVTRVFLHAASLYLASVLNGPTPSMSCSHLRLCHCSHHHLPPGHPNIRNSVVSLIGALRAVPERTIDLALALPIALVGCLAETAEQREFVHARLRLLEEVIGNMRSVRLLMERAWAVHGARGGPIDWHDIMKNDLGVEVLLI